MTGGLDPKRWLDDYGDTLYHYALTRVRVPAAAEDLVQETLVAALKAQHAYQQRSSEKTWLVGILKHKIIDYLRKASRETQLTDDGDGDADLSVHYFDQRGRWHAEIGDWGAPEKSLENEQFWAVLSDCLEKLPKKMAAVFMLREMDGLSADEICKTMDVSSTNNVWVMLSRIRMRIRQCVEVRYFNTRDEG